MPEQKIDGTGSATLALWCAYPDDLLDDRVAAASAAILSDEERARAARFRFERRQRESVATSALTRTALAHAGSLPAAEWQFSRNPHGKPEIIPDTGLRFNVSNCEELVVCLVAHNAEVGVDAEPLTRAEAIAGLAPHVFSVREQKQLNALDGAERLDRALSLWVLKESYIKARGLGLALGLRKFSFVFGEPEGIRLELDPGLGDAAERWCFRLLDVTGHRVALMVESQAVGALELWEARPPHGPGKQLADAEGNWFLLP